MKKISWKVLLGVAATCAGLSVTLASSVAKEGPPRLLARWDKGSTIELCSSQGGRCFVTQLPTEIGIPKKMIEGDFVKGSPLSWIVQSKSSVSLCAVSGFGPTISCAAISKSLSTADIKTSKEKNGAMRFELRDAGKIKLLERRGKHLAKNYEAAKTRLDHEQVAPVYSPMLIDIDELPPEECDPEDEFSEVYCEVADTGGGSGSGGGEAGGGGGGGGVVIIIGQKPAPPPPVDPHTPGPLPPSEGPGFWCTVFGIGCPTLPTVPEPPPKDCVQVSRDCNVYCTDATLPTGTYDGAPFYRCKAECMERNGC